MLIKTTTSVSNQVYAASVAVEADTLESEYFTAYGEPQIDLAGDITYTPPAGSTPVGQITLDAETDLGTPPVSGSVEDVAALDAVEISGSGAFPTGLLDTVGFFNYAVEVVSDFEMKARIDYVDGGLIDTGTDPTTVDGFRVGLALYDGDDSDDPSVIFGWGSHNSSLNLALWHRATKGGAYSEINTVARDDFKGLYLKLVRDSLTLNAYYSIDNGETWNLLGSTTLARQAYRVGLFINSGTATLCNAVISNLSLTQSTDEDPNTFTISGGQKLAYIRSQSPHVFSLDGKVDDEAEEKVDGWAATIKARIIAAKTALFENDVPSGSSGDTTITQA